MKNLFVLPLLIALFVLSSGAKIKPSAVKTDERRVFILNPNQKANIHVEFDKQHETVVEWTSVVNGKDYGTDSHNCKHYPNGIWDVPAVGPKDGPLTLTFNGRFKYDETDDFKDIPIWSSTGDPKTKKGRVIMFTQVGEIDGNPPVTLSVTITLL